MNFCKSFFTSLFLTLLCLINATDSFSQDRERVIKNNKQIEIDGKALQEKLIQTSQRPILPNRTFIVQHTPTLVKKTVSSQPINYNSYNSAVKSLSSPAFSQNLLFALQKRIGIPYRMGSTGPNSYDCSGLVWSVFQDAGIFYERSSARTLWHSSEKVEGDERFKFGTLVFFNRLGHIGIVVDENGFYHASSSKGVTYSKFDGYWAKRIVGFRQMIFVK
jgi:cell wall-associated NlpC family hydrolase